MTNEFLFPQEPIRLSIENTNEILIHCVKLGASDITLQTGEAIFAEIYGRLKKVTRRRLSNTEVGEVINAMYGPNGTTQIMSGKAPVKPEAYPEKAPAPQILEEKRDQDPASGSDLEETGHAAVN